VKLLALIGDTLREIYARKAIIGIVIIELLTLIVTGLILFTDGMQTTYREAAEGDMLMRSDSAQRAPIEEREPAEPRNADDSLLLGMSGTAVDSSDTAAPTRGNESRTLQTPPPAIAQQSLPENFLLLEMVKGQMSAFAVPISLAFLFFGIFVSAGIIPSMLEKGTIDLLASKPISRTALLFGRAFGGLLTMATNLLLFVTAIWAIYGWATGIWYAPFILWTFVIPLFAFIVIYSGIIVLNVVTESSVLPMILAYIHLMILSNLLSGREEILYTFIESKVWRGLIDGLYYILPQTNDYLRIVPQAIFTGQVTTPEPFIQGAIFTAVMLGLAAWRMERKDF
jgi:ABC-type transport system involved in multi-copper enzyme maturation permease subunit